MANILSGARTKVRTLLRRFGLDKSGNVAIVFALSAVPISVMIGATVDFSSATKVRAKMQNSLDSAALSAIAASHLGESQRREYAINEFNSNFLTADIMGEPTTEVTFDGDAVTTSSSIAVATNILGIININEITVSASSTAIATESEPVCMLALNPTKEDAIRLVGTTRLDAVNCAVHANSNHSAALSAVGTSSATAKSFTMIGGSTGNDHFTPAPQGGKSEIEDPYKTLTAPSTSGCDHSNKQFKNGTHTATPGVYCGGLEFKAHADVTLSPGTYVIKNGPLKVGSQSTVAGNGVTFYFTGYNTELDIGSQAAMTLTAPGTGDLAGLVFVQDPDSNPYQVNVINGGGDIQIVGTFYFPTHVLDIRGGGAFGATSPQFSMIADSFILRGNGTMTLNVDHVSAALPPAEPMTKAAARLTN